jgi:Ser/Thr protein kinase RdoA (MazF antagonist)
MTLDLNSLIACWPQCGRVTSAQPVAVGGFSGASVFRVQTETGEFALRQWPDDSLPVTRIRELHRFLLFLKQNGIDFVAVPCPDETGATVVSFQESWWQLEPWLAGSAIWRQRSPERLANVMRSLARLHLAAAKYVPTESGRPWFYQSPAQASPAVIERLQMVRYWGEGRVRVVAANDGLFSSFSTWFAPEFVRCYIRAAPTIARELELCAALRFHVHPCLRDVHREHVLLTDDEVTGIIDASAARSENVASDLSRLLGSLLGDDGGDLWERALDAYSAVRELSQDERRLVRVLDRSGVLLSGLTWVRGVVGISEPSRAIERMHEIHQRLQVLVEGIC